MDDSVNNSLELLLKKYTRIALDTNSFIYLMEKNPVYIDKVRAIFKQIESGNVFGITSMLLITEVLTKPIKDNNKALELQYKTFIGAFPNLHIRDVDYAIALKAAKLRAKYNIHTPDSIFIATAIEESAQAFVTNDIRLKNVEEIDFILLNELQYNSL